MAESRPERIDYATVMNLTKTDESIAMSKDLKRRGWSWVGPTTAYAFVQSMGMVNDHVEGCEWRFPEGEASLTRTETLRQPFKRPNRK